MVIAELWRQASMESVDDFDPNVYVRTRHSLTLLSTVSKMLGLRSTGREMLILQLDSRLSILLRVPVYFRHWCEHSGNSHFVAIQLSRVVKVWMKKFFFPYSTSLNLFDCLWIGYIPKFTPLRPCLNVAMIDQ